MEDFAGDGVLIARGTSALHIGPFSTDSIGNFEGIFTATHVKIGNVPAVLGRQQPCIAVQNIGPGRSGRQCLTGSWRRHSAKLFGTDRNEDIFPLQPLDQFVAPLGPATVISARNSKQTRTDQHRFLGSTGVEKNLLLRLRSHGYPRLRLDLSSPFDLTLCRRMARIAKQNNSLTSPHLRFGLLFPGDTIRVNDSEGVYVLDRVPEAVYRIAAANTEYSFAESELDVQGVAQAAHDFTAATGQLNGVVTDQASGTPLERAQVIVVSLAADTFGRIQLHTNTAADGAYAFDSLVDGDYLIVVEADGFARTLMQQTISETLPTQLDFQLGAGHTLGGTVTDSSTGDPIPEASLRMVDTRWPDHDPGYYIVADSSGAYLFESLQDGDYEIRAYAQGYVPVGTTVEVSGPASLEIPLSDVGHVISVRVTELASGLPVSGAIVLIERPGHLPVVLETSTDGAVEYGPLESGEYRATSILDGASAETVVSLDSHQNVELEIDLATTQSHGSAAIAGNSGSFQATPSGTTDVSTDVSGASKNHSTQAPTALLNQSPTAASSSSSIPKPKSPGNCVSANEQYKALSEKYDEVTDLKHIAGRKASSYARKTESHKTFTQRYVESALELSRGLQRISLGLPGQSETRKDVNTVLGYIDGLKRGGITGLVEVASEETIRQLLNTTAQCWYCVER